jgi:hypothetical protein
MIAEMRDCGNAGIADSASLCLLCVSVLKIRFELMSLYFNTETQRQAQRHREFRV